MKFIVVSENDEHHIEDDTYNITRYAIKGSARDYAFL
jgi:hypothetical protein